MDSISEKIEDKLEGAVLISIEYDAQADAIKNEINRLRALKERYEKRAQNIRDYVLFCMRSAELKKISGDRVSITYSMRKQSKIEIVEPALVPYAYMREKITHEPDKTAIKEAIKKGECVSGCALVDTVSLIIK